LKIKKEEDTSIETKKGIAYRSRRLRESRASRKLQKKEAQNVQITGKKNTVHLQEIKRRIFDTQIC